MAFRELGHMDVKEVLRRWQDGQSVRRVDRETGADRKTVKRYFDAAVASGLPRDRALTDAEIHEVATRVQGRSLPDASDQWQEVARFKDEIQGWLERSTPLKLSKIHTLLKRRGLRASYQTLRRFATKELGHGMPKVTVRVADAPPGQEAQVDFGKMGMIKDAATGRMIALYALVVTLCFSRYQFVWPVLLQTTEAVIEGLEAAWRFFGGMAKILIPDNTKAMVKKFDPLSPELVDAFADYVQARGMFVDPARVRHAKDKGRVENQVPFVRESWFQGESFGSLEEARESGLTWSRDVAGARIHGTTRRVPREMYEAEEQPHMLPAPSESYDVPLFGEAQVHPDHHINFARALYSMPTKYIGKKVRVRADKQLVKIYAGTELVKTHPRQVPGGRATDANDYPPGKAAYAMRSVDALLAQAKQRGHNVGVYAERVLNGPLPWTRMRQAYALIGLCDKYGNGRVEALCQSALAFDVVDVARLKKMLGSATLPQAVDEGGAKVVALPAATPRFARPASEFATRKDGGEKEGT